MRGALSVLTQVTHQGAKFAAKVHTMSKLCFMEGTNSKVLIPSQNTLQWHTIMKPGREDNG